MGLLRLRADSIIARKRVHLIASHRLERAVGESTGAPHVTATRTTQEMNKVHIIVRRASCEASSSTQIGFSPATTPSVVSRCTRPQAPYRIVQARNFWARDASGAGSSPISAASTRSGSREGPLGGGDEPLNYRGRMLRASDKDGNRHFLRAGST